MCRLLLWLARIGGVGDESNRTAKTPSATGVDAPTTNAVDSETPQTPTSGSGLDDMTDEVVAQAKRDLHDAIEVYMRVAYENVLATTDWLLISENVMSDDDETRMLHPAISEHMSSWKLTGMTVAAVKHFSQATY